MTVFGAGFAAVSLKGYYAFPSFYLECLTPESDNSLSRGN